MACQHAYLSVITHCVVGACDVGRMTGTAKGRERQLTRLDSPDDNSLLAANHVEKLCYQPRSHTPVPIQALPASLVLIQALPARFRPERFSVNSGNEATELLHAHCD